MVLFYAGLNGAVFVISGWRELIRVLIISMGAGLGMAVGQAVRKHRANRKLPDGRDRGDK